MTYTPKIVVTLGHKGGGGKSTTAVQFVSAFFSEEEKNNNIPFSVFEFDAHNEGLEKTETDFITKTIGNNPEKIKDALSEIEYQSDERNFIIDVGGSDNTDRFLKYFKDKKNIIENTIFIIPELNEPDTVTDTTIKTIQSLIPNANIIVALNRYNDAKSVKKDFCFAYGDDTFGIPPKKFVSDKSIVIATLPDAPISIGLARLKKTTLYILAKFEKEYSGLSIKKRKALWADKEKGETVCSESVYIAKNREIDASLEAQDTLQKAESLFEAIRKVSKGK